MEPKHMLNNESHYRLLRALEDNPTASQRDLSRALGISVGKVNYCMRALMEKGLVKMRNFRDNHNKLSYAYILTPQGMRRKAEITMAFLQRKQREYERLQGEIAELREELQAQQQSGLVETDSGWASEGARVEPKSS
jgi:EPS-associated MarR family transcriptional regulator